MNIEEQIKKAVKEAVAEAIQPLVEHLQNQLSQSNHQKPLLTLEEAMEILGVGKNRMYEIVKTDDFPAFREGKRWMIITHKFYEWMEKQTEKIV
ncbi:helix-turn-helix domain-containing protein [Bacillus cereus group sp. TH228LC]|nr:helix-turn-helix domain-containing protein [Bacillus cereus group sp. TH228LC]MDA1577251.1 helix-turn-helix domain-containing protein [Bacillus cereus group sp. TH228LC]